MASRRKLAFILAATDHGALIVNRFDYHTDTGGNTFGVGFDLLETGRFGGDETKLIITLLDRRREYNGDGVVALDCGANIGVHTIEWAKYMGPWGSVVSIEAQERIFYALCGNITLNNCFNARAIHAAIGSAAGTMRMPQPDYTSPGSFGSFELRDREKREYIGQSIDYAATDALVDVRMLSIDSLVLPRLDLIKIDIEGMEIEALRGAHDTIARCHPILFLEYIKSDHAQLSSILKSHGYDVFVVGQNFLAIHQSDQCLGSVRGQKL